MMEIQPSAFSLQPLVLILAFLLDLAIGDPRWLPHPVRIIGSAVAKTETILRGYFKTPLQEKFGGALLVIMVVAPVSGITFFIQKIIIAIPSLLHYSITPLLHYPINALELIALVYLTSTTIAVRELINSARIVIESVKNKDIESAKSNLGMIVGRDTRNLSEKGILKATIETLSENLSDGIIAPLFYLAIGGLPLAMAYKAINTLDSMVGYKNDKYKDFGWAAARLDDIANYIPARISGILIVTVSFFVSRSLFTVHCSLKTMIRDGRKHLSPNAGIPEAAIAGALGVKLGGPSTYNGIEIQKPYIGMGKTENYLIASEKAMDIIKVSSLIGTGIAATILYIRNIL